MFNFDPTKLIESENLGEGGYGNVFPYRSKEGPNGEKWAVKVQEVDFERLCRAMQEITVGFKCQHKNILPVSGFHIEKVQEPYLKESKNKKERWLVQYKVYIKMPRMKQNLLAKYIQQKGQRFSELQILGYFYGIVCGLMELHKEEIAHKDIKPENILLDENGIIKIADIGLAKCLKKDIDSKSMIDLGGGTLNYIAPEIRELMEKDPKSKIKKDAHLKADLWSLGATMLDLCLLKQGVLGSAWSFEKIFQRLKETYSDHLANLFHDLLQDEAEKRIKLEELAKKLEVLLGIPPEKRIKNGRAMEEELEDNRFISSEKNRKSGEVGVESMEERPGSILIVRDEMRKSSQEKFAFEADETGRAFILKANKDQQKLITDQNLEELFSGLFKEFQKQNYTRLDNLKLEFNYCQNITGVKGLAAQIGSHFENITKLDLDFSNCSDISDSGVKELAVNMGLHLKNITQLHLNFFCCGQITDSGFKELTTQIGLNLNNITQLYLNFAYCFGITDSGLKEFSNQIGLNLKNLTQLELYFSGCYEITDLGFADLATQIGLRNNITLLRLFFPECGQITDSGFKELKAQIGSSLKNLTQLYLDFSFCNQISGPEVTELVTKISLNLKNMTNLRLAFGPALNNEAKQLLRDTLTRCKTWELL